MARDKAQFRNAVKKWQGFIDEDEVSKRAENGATAVVTTGFYKARGVSAKEAARDAEYHRREGDYLADKITGHGTTVHRIHEAGPTDFADVFADRDIASLYIIGGGTLSSVFMADPEDPQNRYEYDWLQAANDGTHVKTGIIVLRFCVSRRRELNVPFGAFNIETHSNIFAPNTAAFNPEKVVPALQMAEEAKIRPIVGTDVVLDSYRQAKDLFPRELV